jgi:tetratricopeptide (TPR) repeat protein
MLLALALSLNALLLTGQRKQLVPPNSAEEIALNEARVESDPAKRLAALDAWVQKYPNYAAAAHAAYMMHHLQAQEWDKALEWGRKAGEADPDDYEVASNVMKAALGKADLAEAVRWGAAAGAALNKVLVGPKPSNLDDDEWKSRVEQLQGVKQHVEYSVYDACLKDADMARRAPSLELLNSTFAGGTYARQAPGLLAVAYQQLQDGAKMVLWAQKALEVDANNETMHLILGEDDLSKKGFDSAIGHGQAVVKIMDSKAKPDTMAEADWANYKKAYQGAAKSVVGRALMQQQKPAAAIPELLAASAALENNPAALGAVLYNLAYAYALQKNMVEAKKVAARAVAIPGPFQKLARELQGKLGK